MQSSPILPPATRIRSTTAPPISQLNCSAPEELLQELETCPEKRVSFYVQSLDDFLSVIVDEAFLFTAKEENAIKRILNLDYEAKYLLIRLYLRLDRFIKINSLEYQDDITDLATASAALFERAIEEKAEEEEKMEIEKSTEMNKSFSSISTTIMEDGRELLDLTGESDDETNEPEKDLEMEAEIELKKVKKEGTSLPESGEIEPSYEMMAEGVDVLNQLPLIEILGVLSGTQITQLAKEMGVGKGSTRKLTTDALLRTLKQSTLRGFGIEFDQTGIMKPQLSLVERRALAMIGGVVRLNSAYRSLLDRASLIYHRTSYVGNATSLTSSLLARFGKRCYPEYKVNRTSSIFSSRKLLLRFQSALVIERKMEECLGEVGEVEVNLSKEERKEKRELGYKEGIELYLSIEEEWKGYCAEGKMELKVEEEIGIRESKRTTYAFKRFHPGWPLTRVVYKAAGIYGKLKDRPAEMEILKLLLKQKSFRRGKRGDFYERLALLLQNYPSELELMTESEDLREKLKRKRLKETRELCIFALDDSHLIYHPALQRRINRIESTLDLPKSERSNFQSSLKKAAVRIMEGERTDGDNIESGRKSIWRGEGGAEVSVETLALQQYKKEGWKGFHSEGGILTTLFSLLFWDVIFTNVVGTFQTAYQSAPLDLNSDSFAIVRKSIINKRLNQLRDGEAAEILKITDDRERIRNTWVVGVNWNKYCQSDLLEIVNCISGSALAIICQHFCENYAERRGGIPDLCLWDPDDETILFSEVKGPNDSLSNTQDVWIDVLLSAGVEVEVCRVATVESILQEQEKSQEKAEAARIKKLKGGNKRKRKESESDKE